MQKLIGSVKNKELIFFVVVAVKRKKVYFDHDDQNNSTRSKIRIGRE